MSLAIKRAYDAPTSADGFRVLVDRLWPRGRSKSALQLDAWMKDISPSAELRKWAHGNPDRWPEFKKRYFEELKGQPDLVKQLRAKAKAGAVTLVYAARNEARNNAVALKEYLERS